MASVHFSHASKTYPGPTAAVTDFTLDVSDGEFLVLLGPSGCGKSTVLRLVAGLEELSGGSISIGGRAVNGVAPRDRDIAMVFQNYALYPHMTVFDNMAFALRRRGVRGPELRRRVADTARSLGIEALLARKPAALSGGQMQRVALGRAIVREPKVFLFDEPLSNLDAQLRLATRAELRALHQRLRVTSIYVTHDQEEAMTLADRIAVMSRGLIQQVGTPLDIYRRPANRFVAEFLGVPTMNFLEGRLVASGQGVAFEAGDAVRLSVSSAHAGALASRAGSAAVLGLRPRALREAGTNGTVWACRVTLVEPLGDSMDVHCSTGPHSLVARMGAREGLRPGDLISLAPDESAAHFFEPGEFGRSLLA